MIGFFLDINEIYKPHSMLKKGDQSCDKTFQTRDKTVHSCDKTFQSCDKMGSIMQQDVSKKSALRTGVSLITSWPSGTCRYLSSSIARGNAGCMSVNAWPRAYRGRPARLRPRALPACHERAGRPRYIC